MNLDISSLVRIKENLDLPKTSTLGKKSSDVFGNIQTNFNKNINFKYNFALDNNFNKTNYDSFSTTFSLNKLVTTFEYFDEKDNSENESFTSNSTTLKLDDNSSINFSLRRNNELSATEYYNLIYNYKNDCLMASVKFKKEYYKDSDLEPEKKFSLNYHYYHLQDRESFKIMKKKILLNLIIFITIITTNVNSLENKLLYKINNEIITSIDLTKEKKYIVILNPALKNLEQSKINQIAIDSILNEKIKEIEIKKYFKNVNFIENENLEKILKNLIQQSGYNSEKDFKILKFN